MLMQFMKGDIVRHLGLLDLQRTMQRALRRSGLPVAYSKGFNPHIVMSFASALSDRKSTRLNSSHTVISYAVFCLKKKKK